MEMVCNKLFLNCLIHSCEDLYNLPNYIIKQLVLGIQATFSTKRNAADIETLI